MIMSLKRPRDMGKGPSNEGCDSELGESPNIDSPPVASQEIEYSR